MGLNSVGPLLQSPLSEYQFQNRPQKNGENANLSPKQYSVDARMVSEYYSSKSLSFEYTSKDGDSVSFSMESIEYSKSIMEVSAEGNKDDMKELIDFIKENYDQMKKDMIRGFLKSIGAEVPPEEQVKEVEPAKKLQIPEYWNAENTSQRIVDFAISFSGLFEGSGDEFLSMIKEAVEEGFKQAREILGKLPDEVSGLIDDTYRLVMEKLDAWGNDQNAVSNTVVESAA